MIYPEKRFITIMRVLVRRTCARCYVSELSLKRVWDVDARVSLAQHPLAIATRVTDRALLILGAFLVTLLLLPAALAASFAEGRRQKDHLL